MKEQLISFDTAILAKEKGFNPFCVSRYDENGVLTATKMGMHSLPNNYGNSYAAPTQSLLQKWLREKHKIIVYWTHDFTKPRHSKYVYDYEIHSKQFESCSCGKQYKTPEEALEAGLLEALKLIEI